VSSWLAIAIWLWQWCLVDCAVFTSQDLKPLQPSSLCWCPDNLPTIRFDCGLCPQLGLIAYIVILDPGMGISVSSIVYGQLLKKPFETRKRWHRVVEGITPLQFLCVMNSRPWCVDEDKSLLFCFDWKSEDATAAKVLSCVVKKFWCHPTLDWEVYLFQGQL